MSRAGPLAVTFGSLVHRERRARGMKIRDLAALSGVSPPTIARTEKGVNEVSLTLAARLATALGLDLNSLADPPPCPACQDSPPAGYTCNTCLRGESR